MTKSRASPKTEPQSPAPGLGEGLLETSLHQTMQQARHGVQCSGGGALQSNQPFCCVCSWNQGRSQGSPRASQTRLDPWRTPWTRTRRRTDWAGLGPWSLSGWEQLDILKATCLQDLLPLATPTCTCLSSGSHNFISQLFIVLSICDFYLDHHYL